jgi:endonuclease/exonuclease/phosphatase family metal-dependent hydrolase
MVALDSLFRTGGGSGDNNSSAATETDPPAASRLARWYEAATSGVRSPGFPRRLSRLGRGEPFSFLFYNTWLLDGVELPTLEFGPFGRVSPGTVGHMPDLAGRTRDFCRALDGSSYDVVAMCEVFRESTRNRLADEVGWVADSHAGPGSAPLERLDIPSKHSGLCTLTGPDTPIVDTTDRGFSHRGHSLRDADFYANKGAQHVEVDVGPGSLDVFTTHLIHGGDLNLTPNELPFADPPSIEEYRARQLSELAEFVQTAGSEENITVVTGDFNINAADPRLVSERNRGEDELFEQFLAVCSLYDAWERHGGSVGTTYIEHGPPGGMARAKPDPAAPDYLEDRGRRCNYPAVPDRRIDYILLEEPQPEHTLELDIDQIRRRHFWRGKTDTSEFWATSEIPNYISDHVGLELDGRVR